VLAPGPKARRQSHKEERVAALFLRWDLGKSGLPLIIGLPKSERRRSSSSRRLRQATKSWQGPSNILGRCCLRS
jgi:hypothetical protein